MEALELYRDENRKMEEHKYACESAGKQVRETHTHTKSNSKSFFLANGLCCVLQLALPKPNLILVALGNMSVSKQRPYKLTHTHMTIVPISYPHTHTLP